MIRITTRKKILALVTLFVLLLVLQQTIDFGGDSRIARGIQNGAHGPWFACVTYLIWRLISVIPTRSMGDFPALLFTLLLAGFLASATEYFQLFTGRQPSWEDFFLDMSGALASVHLIAWYRYSFLNARKAFFLAGVVLLALSQYPLVIATTITGYVYAVQPRLLGFDWFLDYVTMSTESDVEIVDAPCSWSAYRDRKVLKIRFADQTWPGISLKEPLPDWSSYSHLVVELFNDSQQGLPLNISVRPRIQSRHREHHSTENFYQGFQLSPGVNSLRVPIDDFLPQRNIVDWRVRYLVIYTLEPFAGRTVYIGEVRLE
ncbi:MAG: VanZ family protein [Candidatus Scalindua sp.]|nr:VanZ family protein [Candidatus Scalindua sp.]